jgi:hypothetical protein
LKFGDGANEKQEETIQKTGAQLLLRRADPLRWLLLPHFSALRAAGTMQVFTVANVDNPARAV